MHVMSTSRMCNCQSIRYLCECDARGTSEMEMYRTAHHICIALNSKTAHEESSEHTNSIGIQWKYGWTMNAQCNK